MNMLGAVLDGEAPLQLECTIIVHHPAKAKEIIIYMQATLTKMALNIYPSKRQNGLFSNFPPDRPTCTAAAY